VRCGRLHESCRVITRELETFENKFYRESSSSDLVENMMSLSFRMKIIQELDGLLYTISKYFFRIKGAGDEQPYSVAFVESLDMLLLSLNEILENRSTEDAKMLLKMTGERGDILKKSRAAILQSQLDGDIEMRSALLQISAQFERAVTLIHELVLSMDLVEEAEISA